MKIGMVDNLPEGGAKRVVFEQLKGLANDHEVYYITNTMESSFNYDELPIKIKQFELEINQGRGLARVKSLTDLYHRLKQQYSEIHKYFLATGVEVIIAHPDRFTQAPWILEFSGIPSIYFAEEWLRVVYEPEWHKIDHLSPIKQGLEMMRRRMIKKIDDDLVHKANQIVTTSNYNANHFTDVYCRDSSVIPLGVDLQTFIPAKNFNERKNYFLFIGELDTYHGYDLVEEIKAIAPSELQIKVVSFKNNKFRLTDEQLKEFYQGAVATLCLDHQEPFGLIPLESMACGTPVIAVNEGGYLETVDDGGTGFLVSRDPKQIFGLMMKLAIDPWLRLTMGKKARAIVADYSWSKHIIKLNGEINGLVNHNCGV
jgi:glycosyltransferase involved in cell wall biosynthesis